MSDDDGLSRRDERRLERRERRADWPDPAPEPEVEPGENPETHLLPTLDRLRSMTREQRHDLLERVADWTGPLVDQFRARVTELDR